MEQNFKIGSLGIALAVSIVIHVVLLVIPVISARVTNSVRQPPITLMIDFYRSTTTDNRHDQQKISAEQAVDNANIPQEVHNQSKNPLLIEKPFSQPTKQLSSKNANRQTLKPAPKPAHPANNSTATGKPIQKKPQLENSSEHAANTPSAATLIERSIAIIRNTPLKPEDKDFSNYLLKKRLESIKDIENILNNGQASSPQSGEYDEYTNAQGDTFLTFYLGNGKKICVEIPADGFPTSTFYDDTHIWRHIPC